MHPNRHQSPISILLVLCTAVALASCAGSQTRNATSVVDYLYPNRDEQVVEPSVPVLNLPLRVGVAFVPGESRDGRRTNWQAGGSAGAALTEKQKMALMQEVAAHFKQYDFVKSIELIPSSYLTPKGSFGNLDQIRTMYGVDVIALLSYDQVQFTDEGLASISYWTLIGAYIIPGEKNDTHTMLDAVVMDIPSRKMLFRAPGTSHVKGRATPVNLSEELRKDSAESFKLASGMMVANLDEQLSLFTERVKEEPEDYKVVHKSGYTGGSSFGLELFPLLLLLLSASLMRRRA